MSRDTKLSDYPPVAFCNACGRICNPLHMKWKECFYCQQGDFVCSTYWVTKPCGCWMVRDCPHCGGTNWVIWPREDLTSWEMEDLKDRLKQHDA